MWQKLIPVAERSKASVCSRSLAGTADSNPVGSMDVRLLWVLFFATGLSLVQRSSTDFGVLLCVIQKAQE
jgi:hypothetical protein